MQTLYCVVKKTIGQMDQTERFIKVFYVYTVELQWLEHWWLVYHGCFELVLESLGKYNLAAD